MRNFRDASFGQAATAALAASNKTAEQLQAELQDKQAVFKKMQKIHESLKAALSCVDDDKKLARAMQNLLAERNKLEQAAAVKTSNISTAKNNEQSPEITQPLLAESSTQRENTVGVFRAFAQNAVVSAPHDKMQMILNELAKVSSVHSNFTIAATEDGELKPAVPAPLGEENSSREMRALPIESNASAASESMKQASKPSSRDQLRVALRAASNTCAKMIMQQNTVIVCTHTALEDAQDIGVDLEARARSRRAAGLLAPGAVITTFAIVMMCYDSLRPYPPAISGNFSYTNSTTGENVTIPVSSAPPNPYASVPLLAVISLMGFVLSFAGLRLWRGEWDEEAGAPTSNSNQTGITSIESVGANGTLLENNGVFSSRSSQSNRNGTGAEESREQNVPSSLSDSSALASTTQGKSYGGF